MALCADDIELWPPDQRPLLGRTAVLAQMAHGTTRIHLIEISDCRIRGSNEIAYLTASYKTTFSPEEDPSLDKLSEAICGYCESGLARLGLTVRSTEIKQLPSVEGRLVRCWNSIAIAGTLKSIRTLRLSRNNRTSGKKGLI